jgi:hypothetical protein
VNPIRDARGFVCRLDHGAGVVQAAAERLLAEHVLPGGEQALGDLPVQLVGDHDADHVYVVVGGDRPPGGVVAFVPESPCGGFGQRRVHIGDRD